MKNKIVIINDSGLSYKLEDWHPETSLEPLQRCVGGFIEIVRAHRPAPGIRTLLGDEQAFTLVAIVDDEGVLKNKRINLAGTFVVGYPDWLVGTVVIAREDFNDDGEPDIMPLTEPQWQAVEYSLAAIGVRKEK